MTYLTERGVSRTRRSRPAGWSRCYWDISEGMPAKQKVSKRYSVMHRVD